MPDHRRPRPPPGGGWYGEGGSGHRAAIASQLRGRRPDRPPAAGPVGSHVQALARPERHDLACWIAATVGLPWRWARGSCRPARRNAVQAVLFSGRTPATVQGDLGHRPELAMNRCTHQQARGRVLRAQGNLEILYVADHRGDTARRCPPARLLSNARVLSGPRWLFDFGRMPAPLARCSPLRQSPTGGGVLFGEVPLCRGVPTSASGREEARPRHGQDQGRHKANAPTGLDRDHRPNATSAEQRP